MHPLELSVRDEQLILTTAAAVAVAAGQRGLEELVTTLFRQLLHHHVNIWKAKWIMRVNNCGNQGIIAK